MKKITLDTINLNTVVGVMGFCDFCGENLFGREEQRQAVKGNPVKYKALDYKKNEYEASYTPIICFNCIKQLSAIIK